MTGGTEKWTFAQELRVVGGPGLARANLLLAREIAYPALQPMVYLAQLDGWGAEVRRRCAGATEPRERASCLSSFLFAEVGLRGNAAEYYDPRNSYLNEVMDRRLGLPIALSAIFLEVAKRAGVPAYGVGLPGHFVVAVVDGDTPWLLDPFHGGAWLTREDATALVRSMTGTHASFDHTWLTPVSPLAMLTRMLQNLRGVYLRSQAWAPAVAVLEHLRMIQPQDPEHLRDLGLVSQRAGQLRRAVEYLEDYLLAVGDAPEGEPIRQSLNVLVQQLARLN